MFAKVSGIFQKVVGWFASPKQAKSVAKEDWQYKAYLHAIQQDKVQTVIDAPTGSGKSIVQLTLAIKKAVENPSSKIVLVSHSKQMVRQFQSEMVTLPITNWCMAAVILSLIGLAGGATLNGAFYALGAGGALSAVAMLWKKRSFEWLPSVKLLDEKEHIEKMRQFLLADLSGKSLQERSLLCCHATISQAGAAVALEQLKDTILVVDECDKAKCLPESEANQLGRFINKFYHAATVKGTNCSLILASATMLRNDGGICVPSAIVNNGELEYDVLTTCVYKHEKHEHIKNANLTILGEVDGVRRASQLIRSLSRRFRKGNKTKTLVYVPAASSRKASSNPDYANAKLDYRDRVLQAISGYTKDPDWRAKAIVGKRDAFLTIKRKGGAEYTVVDLVDNSSGSADKAKRDYLAALRDGDIPTPPNLVIVALFKFVRGSDLPCLDRIINLGIDKSMTQAEQKFGRLLRRHEGKTDVEYVQYIRMPARLISPQSFRRMIGKFMTAYIALGCKASLLQATQRVDGVVSGPSGRPLPFGDAMQDLDLNNIRENDIVVRLNLEVQKRLPTGVMVRSVEITPELLQLLKSAFAEQRTFGNPELHQTFDYPAKEFKGPFIRQYRKLLSRHPENRNLYIHPTDDDLKQRSLEHLVCLRQFWIPAFAERNSKTNKVQALYRRVLPEQIQAEQALRIVQGSDEYAKAKSKGQSLETFINRNGLQEIIKYIKLPA